jgi:hypothetical protein
VDVWVNCKAVGKAPAAVSVAGAALVALHAGPRAAGMLVEPARSELHEIALAPAEEAKTADEDAAELLRATGASQLYWVRRDGERWVVDRFSPTDGWKRAFRRFDPKPAATVKIRAHPAEEPTRGAPVLGWVLAGSAAGALVAGVVTAALARSAADEIERKASAEEVFDPADHDDNRRYRTVSYATLAVGGALAAGAIVYWLLRWRRRPAARSVPGRSAPARGVAPLLPSARAGLRFQGPGLAIGW